MATNMMNLTTDTIQSLGRQLMAGLSKVKVGNKTVASNSPTVTRLLKMPVVQSIMTAQKPTQQVAGTIGVPNVITPYLPNTPKTTTPAPTRNVLDITKNALGVIGKAFTPANNASVFSGASTERVMPTSTPSYSQPSQSNYSNSAYNTTVNTVDRNLPIDTTGTTQQPMTGEPTGQVTSELQSILDSDELKKFIQKKALTQFSGNTLDKEIDLQKILGADTGFQDLSLDQARKFEDLRGGTYSSMREAAATALENMVNQDQASQDREMEILKLQLAAPEGTSFSFDGKTYTGLKTPESEGVKAIANPTGGILFYDSQGNIVKSVDAFGRENTGSSGTTQVSTLPGSSNVAEYSQLFYGSSANPYGLDMAGKSNSPISTPASGIVTSVGQNGGWGNQVVIEDPVTGYKYQFSHLNSINVQKGQRVNANTLVGLMGNTGNVMGANGEKLTPEQIASGRGTHLDLTIYKNGKPLTAQQVADLIGITKGEKITIDSALKEAGARGLTGDKATEFVNQSVAVQEFPAKAGGTNVLSGVPASIQGDLLSGVGLEQQINKSLELGDSLGWTGVGGMYQGSISQFMAKNFGAGSEEEQALRSALGNITGTIAKLRGGTSFTPNEQILLETYTPTINDSPLVIKSKLNGLRDTLRNNRATYAATYGIDQNAIEQMLPGGTTGNTTPASTGTVDFTGKTRTDAINLLESNGIRDYTEEDIQYILNQ